MARVVVGISGASGSAVAVALLRSLRELSVETHLVMSKWGAITVEHECGLRPAALSELVTVVYRNGDLAAPIASGSFPVDAMIVVPCSARTLASVAAGSGDTLLARAADVTLKERRRLILALREAPLSSIHLRNAHEVSLAGGIVYPLVPSFYNKPSSVDELVHDMATRLAGLAGFEVPSTKHWGQDVTIHRTRAHPTDRSSS